MITIPVMKELNWLKLITLFICSSYKLMSLSFTPVWKFYYCQNNRHEIAVAIYLFHTRVPEVSEVPGPGPGSHFSAMSFSLGYQTFQDKVTLIINEWFFSVKKTTVSYAFKSIPVVSLLLYFDSFQQGTIYLQMDLAQDL